MFRKYSTNKYVNYANVYSLKLDNFAPFLKREFPFWSLHPNDTWSREVKSTLDIQSARVGSGLSVRGIERELVIPREHQSIGRLSNFGLLKPAYPTVSGSKKMDFDELYLKLTEYIEPVYHDAFITAINDAIITFAKHKRFRLLKKLVVYYIRSIEMPKQNQFNSRMPLIGSSKEVLIWLPVKTALDASIRYKKRFLSKTTIKHLRNQLPRNADFEELLIQAAAGWKLVDLHFLYSKISTFEIVNGKPPSMLTLVKLLSVAIDRKEFTIANSLINTIQSHHQPTPEFCLLVTRMFILNDSLDKLLPLLLEWNKLSPAIQLEIFNLVKQDQFKLYQFWSFLKRNNVKASPVLVNWMLSQMATSKKGGLVEFAKDNLSSPKELFKSTIHTILSSINTYGTLKPNLDNKLNESLDETRTRERILFENAETIRQWYAFLKHTRLSFQTIRLFIKKSLETQSLAVITQILDQSSLFNDTGDKYLVQTTILDAFKHSPVKDPHLCIKIIQSEHSLRQDPRQYQWLFHHLQKSDLENMKVVFGYLVDYGVAIDKRVLEGYVEEYLERIGVGENKDKVKQNILEVLMK